MGVRGRQPDPSPISHRDWKTLGCPPLQLSVLQFCKWIPFPVTAVRLRQLIEQGVLVKDGTRIHTDHPINARWIMEREGAPPPPKPPGRTDACRIAGGSVGETYTPPGEDWGAEDSLAGLDLDAILDAISKQDLSHFRKADIDKIAKLETALKTRVDRETRRGLLIERSLVSVVMGRLYTLHSNQFLTLGTKVSATVAGELGVEDPTAQLRIEELIDGEARKILAHIKRLFDDFLIATGAEVGE